MEVRRVWFHVHPVFEHPEVSQQLASLSQVGHIHPTSGGHVGGKQSATTSHVGTVEKIGRLKGKIKFPCKLCEGDHLTHQCSAIAKVQRV